MVKAGIIEPTGIPAEPVRLLAGHPRVEIVAASSRSQAGGGGWRRSSRLCAGLPPAICRLFPRPGFSARNQALPLHSCMELQPGWLRSFCVRAGRSLT